jgi:exodeoxyribonuclease VII large subunit
MPRKPSSPWEFGELFAGQELRRVLTVAQLTGSVRQLLEERIGTVWVAGEITNLREQASGHAYFTLKDPEAQLSCVLFRNVSFAGRALLDNGARVIAHGDLTVYEPRGQYQLVIRELEFQGAGALQVAFEKLKRELAAKGYFAPERKRPLPRLPERVGLVTSATGAAIRDVLHVVQRRQPGLEVILAACRVQGEGAGKEIAAAIGSLNEWSQRQPAGRGLDLILVTRGGGSLEDLWAFNEVVVAEAIYQSDLPVVSAVGHEIDFTISDFVADVRAATPSAAAEIITEGAYASRVAVTEARRAMGRVARQRVENAGESLSFLRKRLVRCRPTRLLQERMQYVDELRDRCVRLVRSQWLMQQQSQRALHTRLLRIKPAARLAQWRLALGDALAGLRRNASLRLKGTHGRLDGAAGRLRLLSPEQTLARGYSITTAKDGRIVRSSAGVKPGEVVRTRVADGSFTSTVNGL